MFFSPRFTDQELRSRGGLNRVAGRVLIMSGLNVGVQ
jgi:hypothetical protein